MPWLGCPMRYESVPGTFWMLAPGVPGAQRPGVLLALVRDEDKEEGRALTPKSAVSQTAHTCPVRVLQALLLLSYAIACSPILTLARSPYGCTSRFYVCKSTSQIPRNWPYPLKLLLRPHLKLRF